VKKLLVALSFALSACSVGLTVSNTPESPESCTGVACRK
jgi:hypothetical protein